MTAETTPPLVLAGYGKMGSAMLAGWLKAGYPSEKIIILNPATSTEKCQKIAQTGALLNPPLHQIPHHITLVLAMKPQSLGTALAELAPLARHQPLIISIIAGKKLHQFEQAFGINTAVIRAMPNTPAEIGQGITGFIANPQVSHSQKQQAHNLLSVMGDVVELHTEAEMDGVTAISGSGPAYVFYMVEAMAAAGQQLGLSQAVAMKLARATVAGAGALLQHSPLAAATLRENVTSKGGTTEAALNILTDEKNGLIPLMTKAAQQAAKRAEELAQ